MNWNDLAWVGAIGQWVGAAASFLAVVTALWIALDASRREQKREEVTNRPNLVLTELKWSVDDTITLRFFNAGRVPCSTGRVGFILFPASGSLLKVKSSIIHLPETLYPSSSSLKVFKFYEGAIVYGEHDFVRDAPLPHDNKVVYFEYGNRYPLSEYIAEYSFINDAQMYLIGDREIPGRKKLLRKHLLKKTSRPVAFFKKYGKKWGQVLLRVLEKRRGKKKNFAETFDEAIQNGYVLLIDFPFKTSSTINVSMGDLVKIDKQHVERMKGIPEIEFLTEYIIKFSAKVKIKDNALLFSNGRSLVFEKGNFQVT